MRIVLVLVLVLLSGAFPAGASPSLSPPPSARNLLRPHPGPWTPPAAVLTLAGMRFDPETGEAFAVPGEPVERVSQANARARAEATAVRHADGSRHAVVGGAFNRWTVATIDDQGRLVQDCVSSAAEAVKLVRAGTAKERK